MRQPEPASPWVPMVSKQDGPLYLAIAGVIAADIASGRLRAGTRLPPQRALAEQMGVDFTTISRAYNEARRRGLIEGRVGQGTYVRTQASAQSRAAAGVVDMSMNMPPQFAGEDLVERIWRDIGSIQSKTGLDLLLRYQEAGGGLVDRMAGAQWLAALLPDLAPERVLITPGAQGATMAVLGLVAVPGDTIAVEALTYPGFRAMGQYLSLRLRPLAMDGQGILPEAFEAACREDKPKALYCTPTLHNPTTATMGPERRRAIADIAAKFGVPIIEDDAYGMLPAQPVAPIATLAPELTYYISSLSKCLSPALRISYLVAPNAKIGARLASNIRASTSIASPLTSAIATRWIETGSAASVLKAIRQETRERHRLLMTNLPSAQSDPEAFHAWLPLRGAWDRHAFTAKLRSVGIGVVASDAFAVGAAPEAVRLGLGGIATREELETSLTVIADVLDQSPSFGGMVV